MLAKNKGRSASVFICIISGSSPRWVTGEVVLIEFPVFHIAISLSKKLVIEDVACYNDFIFWSKSRGHGRTSLPASLVSRFFGR